MVRSCLNVALYVVVASEIVLLFLVGWSYGDWLVCAILLCAASLWLLGLSPSVTLLLAFVIQRRAIHTQLRHNNAHNFFVLRFRNDSGFLNECCLTGTHLVDRSSSIPVKRRSAMLGRIQISPLMI